MILVLDRYNHKREGNTLKKYIFIVVLFLVTLISRSPQNAFALSEEEIDYTYDNTTEEGEVFTGEDKDDRGWYSVRLKTTIASIKEDRYVNKLPDNYDTNITHYKGISDIQMTTIQAKEIKLSKDNGINLVNGLIETTQKKYSINLTKANWVMISNGEYVELKDGICSLIEYPNKTLKIKFRATTAVKIDGGWRKVVVYFTIIPTHNTATMDKVRTVPIGNETLMELENNVSKNIKWSTSNSKIASITKDGKIKGISKGICNITATMSDGTKLTCKVIVPSKTESSILKKAKGIYSGGDIYNGRRYSISVNDNIVANNPYYVSKLDREFATGVDVFYVTIYDKITGVILENKTFAIHYEKANKANVSFIWWYNTLSPSWDSVILNP